MRIDPLDFPQARMAPESVVRGLEELDPTACIVHLGGARWMVGKVRPNALARVDATHMLDSWTSAVQRSQKKLSPSGRQRVRFAQLALLGVRPVELYTIIGGEPDSRIVQDFKESRYRWLHTSDNEMDRAIDSTEKADASRAALTDVNLAKDAWKHAFTLSHTTSVSTTPLIPARSGWTRHTLSKAS